MKWRKTLKKMSVLQIHSDSLQCSINVPTPGTTQSLQDFVSFYPAVLKYCPNHTLGWYIEYYARSSKLQKLVRYRLRLNIVKRRYRKMSEFYEFANSLVQEINTKLSQGWTPEKNDTQASAAVNSVPNDLMSTPSCFAPSSFVPTPSSTHIYVSMINELQKEVAFLKGMAAQSSMAQPIVDLAKETKSDESSSSVDVDFVPAEATKKKDESNEKEASVKKGVTLVELVDRFIQVKEKTVRKDTFRSYKNYATLFKAYLKKYLPGILADDFSRADAQAYMAYREDEIMKSKAKRGDQKEMSTRTINNHIKAHRLFFSWGIEEELVSNNPFAQLKLQRNEEKRRELVTNNALERVKIHLIKNEQKGFLLVCMLIYSGLIRPKEIRQLRIRDIVLHKHCIIVPSSVSKNHCTRVVGITPEVEELMLELNIDKLPIDYFICGKGLIPGLESAPESAYTKAWMNMRRELKLPDTMQLYSLKDTGITNMLENGVPAIDVMKQAGHHDLSMTTQYANHKDIRIAQKMYNNNLSFGTKKEEEQ
ncbi:MAG: tyrosine-type recombinase/integrase [Paludibacteraceae bacterium]|nr:tyrosine-type recombinase/integrase [Paludibacteraceae bacterium]